MAKAAAASAAPVGGAGALKPAHHRRLRELWRSAGWPCRDQLELDLLAAGLLERHWDTEGRETVRVTEAGIDCLARVRRRHQAALDPHEALVARVVQDMHRSGRLAWRGLNLRAPLVTDTGQTRWVVARPDVFSIRYTTREDCTEPVVHEVKVSRADLLSDLRNPNKGAAYLAVSSQCWYVLRQGIAKPDELPSGYGVMEFDASGQLETVRPAPRRPMQLPFALWMQLAAAAPEAAQPEPAQPLLSLVPDSEP